VTEPEPGMAEPEPGVTEPEPGMTELVAERRPGTDTGPTITRKPPRLVSAIFVGMTALRALAVALAGLCVPLSCVTEHPPSLADIPAGDAGAGGRDSAGPNLGDASVDPVGPCGEERIPAVENPPNLSFIIDHSASMGEELAGSGLSKYENARIALSHVLRAVGHRVNYGAAIFPGLDGVTGCEAGDQLLKMAPGDGPSYAREGRAGPRLRDLLQRLTIADVDGGTPVAATLDEMRPVLAELGGETFVVLITDGAPNCNRELSCAAEGCGPNIEGRSVAGMACAGGHNCCEPSSQSPAANLSCVDGDASLTAVAALSDIGIKTFVVGMPGSEPYRELLNAMADVGGTARPGALKYYPVDDTGELEANLKEIAASVAIACEIPLDYEPPDLDYVNVYFDGRLVEYDPTDGWEWTEAGHVLIHGEACAQLSAGDVLEVQILAGCKTEVK
jgi:hypothetical protein